MMRKGEKNDKRYQQSERKSEFFSLESKKKEYSERKDRVPHICEKEGNLVRVL